MPDPIGDAPQQKARPRFLTYVLDDTADGGWPLAGYALGATLWVIAGPFALMAVVFALLILSLGTMTLQTIRPTRQYRPGAWTAVGLAIALATGTYSMPWTASAALTGFVLHVGVRFATDSDSGPLGRTLAGIFGAVVGVGALGTVAEFLATHGLADAVLTQLGWAGELLKVFTV